VLVLDCDPIVDAPILDLRLRKGVRRHEMKLARIPGDDLDTLRDTARQLSGEGEELVIVWGERFVAGPDGDERARALLDLAAELSLAETDGAGLLEIPASSNGRGLREAGVLPNGGPGLSEPDQDGLDSHAIADALAGGELSALHLLEVDPLSPSDPFAAAPGADSASWASALERATTVVAHATLLSEGIAEHANVIFPAGSYAEKEGTITHPDGRVQRVRQAVALAGITRPGSQVIAELSMRLGLDLDVRNEKEASQQLFDAVAFYEGLTLEEIGGRGVRWQEREAAFATAGGQWAVGASAAAHGTDSPAETPYSNGYTQSGKADTHPTPSSPQSEPSVQPQPSAEQHSGADTETHAADTDTEAADRDGPSSDPPATAQRG
jgi:NADH-quinone oxidoreductase subunit G